MTLALMTESHGEVESGFFAACTQFARIGEHSFATRHLCELVQYLANNPKVSQTRILGYNLEKFWQRNGEYHAEIVQMLAEAQQSYLPELQRMDLERFMEQTQGEVSIDDDVDMYDEGRMIDVRIADGERSISVGMYRIAALEFGWMAVYLAQGGFLGWMNDLRPDFAQQTLHAMKNSTRQLYKEIRAKL